MPRRRKRGSDFAKRKQRRRTQEVGLRGHYFKTTTTPQAVVTIHSASSNTHVNAGDVGDGDASSAMCRRIICTPHGKRSRRHQRRTTTPASLWIRNSQKPKRKRVTDPNDDEVVVVDEATRRLMILDVYANQLDRPAETKNADDIREAVSEIREIFGRRLDRKTISSVIQRYESCPSAYRGQRMRSRNSHRRRKIQPGSHNEGMVVQLLECGLSERACVFIINSHIKDPKDYITRRSVRTCVSALDPEITAVGGIPQGNYSDPTKPWARARKNWATQLLLRLGHLSADELTEDERKTKGLLITDSQKLDLKKIVFWDETHTKCVFHQKKQYRFYTDKDGNPVPRGTPGASAKTKRRSRQKQKNPSELRLLIGVTSSGGGKIAALFDYSGMNVVGIEAWERAKALEVERVKRLAGKGDCDYVGSWNETRAEKPRKDFYANDRLTYLTSKTIAEKFDALGIKTISRLRGIRKSEIRTFAKQSGVSVQRIRCLQKRARGARRGSAPQVIDHRRADNPYESLYGLSWAGTSHASAGYGTGSGGAGYGGGASSGYHH